MFSRMFFAMSFIIMIYGKENCKPSEFQTVQDDLIDWWFTCIIVKPLKYCSVYSFMK